MKTDKPQNAHKIEHKNDIKTHLENNRISTLPNVQPKALVPIPGGAKRIGNYILGKGIGSGTFGKVHMGMHILTGQKVAVKIIQKIKIQAKDVQRVKNEIQILRLTRHRHLIHLYQIIQTQKSLLLITEYMPNGELFSHIVKQKKIQQNQACRIFHQLIDGVEYLHRMGITHRDLKPQNIMIDYDNQIKIIDFGLSRTYSKNQRLASACGSPCYASPEMIDGKNLYDPELVDIWSCGVILYAMVCGTLPFVDTETPKLYKKIISGAYRPIKGVSEDVKDLIQKILIVNPKKRIGIQQIKQHPWWKIRKYEPGYGLFRQQRVQIDEQIVTKTVALGFDRQAIIQSLQANEENKQTGAYFILMKKLVKSGQIIPKYIGDANFNPGYIEYLFNTFQQQISQTAIQSISAQMPCQQSNPQDPTSCTCTQNTKPEQWWVNIGSKEDDKLRKEPSQKNITDVNFLIGFLTKKNAVQEEQKKKLGQEEEIVYEFKKKRKIKKTEFYGINYKKFIKGTSNLKQRYSRNQIPAYMSKPVGKAGDRAITLDALKNKFNVSSFKKTGNFSVNVMVKGKQNLPRILKHRCYNSKNVQIHSLTKDSMKTIKKLQKITIKSLC